MIKKKKRIVFIVDPISSFNPFAETTSFLVKEALKQKMEVWMITLDQIYLKDGMLLVEADLVDLKYSKKTGFSYQLIKNKELNLSSADFIFLRKDPPVDEKFIDHLSLLEILEDKNPHINFINSPTGIKKFNEKLGVFYFDQFSPSTLVSSDKDQLIKFIHDHKKIVLKPLNLSGGRGIYILQSKDNNLNTILDHATKSFSHYVMLQKYIPQAKVGDKRILLFEDEILGCFLRVPSQDDFRGNMHSGANWIKSSVTIKEKKMIQKITPKLSALGLKLIGLDIIGKFITEINVTSPMGIREINDLENTKVEENIFKKLI
jgi:glutathione synthase